MVDVVLDSSAILALLFNEPGGDDVATRVRSAAMSTVNYAESISKLIDRGVPRELCLDNLDKLKLTVVPFNFDAAIIAGVIREDTRDFGLSLGDRACLALAKSLGVAAVTADQAWIELDIGIDIKLIR